MGLFSAKPSVNAQKIIGWLGCECEYFPAGKPAQFISSTYEDAFAKKEMGGYTPVIIVVNDVLSEWFDMLREDSGTSPEDRRRELLSAELPNAQEWFTERLSEMRQRTASTGTRSPLIPGTAAIKSTNCQVSLTSGQRKPQRS